MQRLAILDNSGQEILGPKRGMLDKFRPTHVVCKFNHSSATLHTEAAAVPQYFIRFNLVK